MQRSAWKQVAATPHWQMDVQRLLAQMTPKTKAMLSYDAVLIYFCADILNKQNTKPQLF